MATTASFKSFCNVISRVVIGAMLNWCRGTVFIEPHVLSKKVGGECNVLDLACNVFQPYLIRCSLRGKVTVNGLAAKSQVLRVEHACSLDTEFSCSLLD